MDKAKTSKAWRWTCLCVFPLTLAVCSVASVAQDLKGQTIRMQTWGGTDGQGIQKNIVAPFSAATGAKVTVEEGITSATIAKVVAQRNDPQLDVVLLDDVGVDTLWREGLLEKLDLSKLPNVRDTPQRFIIDDGYGICWGVYVVTIIYNSKLVNPPPKSWKDLWDPKYKGKILLPARAGSQTLFLTLMTARLNGGDIDNLAPAWPAVKQLVANAHSFIENRALAAELLNSGEALIAVDVSNMYKAYVDKGYPLKFANDLQEGVFPYMAGVAKIKGGKGNSDATYAFINTVLSADAQAGLAKDIWYGPTNTKAQLSPRDAEYVMHSPEQWANAVKFDRQKLVGVRASVIQQWNAIAAGQ